jgi:hypothetical protein
LEEQQGIQVKNRRGTRLSSGRRWARVCILRLMPPPVYGSGPLILTHTAHKAYSYALSVMTFFPLQRQLVSKLVHLDNAAEDPIHPPRREASKECLIEPECVELLMNRYFCMLCPGLSQEQRQ